MGTTTVLAVVGTLRTIKQGSDQNGQLPTGQLSAAEVDTNEHCTEHW